MTPGRLSRLREITPVPSHGSIFVYVIPSQNVMPARVTPVVAPRYEIKKSSRYVTRAGASFLM